MEYTADDRTRNDDMEPAALDLAALISLWADRDERYRALDKPPTEAQRELILAYRRIEAREVAERYGVGIIPL